MTALVFDCRHRPINALSRSHGRTLPRQPGRSTGFRAAAVVALGVVPVAGAAEPPYGWLGCALTALPILVVVAAAGHRVPWGWLAIVLAVLGVMLPRGPWGVIGPALLVATTMSGAVWLARRGARRGLRDAGPPPGSRERAAQVLMGFSGERHAADVLARELPPEYALINGLQLPRAAGDIDHLVVGPSGIFLLETKTMAGQIVCESDGTWRRMRTGRAGTQYAAFIGDPVRQVQRNIFAARRSLHTRLPGLFQSGPVWIDGLVIFAHPDTILQADRSRIPALLLDQAVAHILAHKPRRWLQPAEVESVVDALLLDGNVDRIAATRLAPHFARRSAQALVEMALLLPVVLALAFGIVALSRMIQAQTAIIALAHEAGRAGALARTPDEAVDRMRARVAWVAPGLGLNAGAVILEWDLSRFSQDPAEVIAVVRYPLDMRDVPLAGWVTLPVLRAQHVEWIDPFRSGLVPGNENED